MKIVIKLALSVALFQFASEAYPQNNLPAKKLSQAETIEMLIKRFNQYSDSTVYDFSLPDINGKTVKLSDFRNKLVLLNFWFTSCGPCQYQIPYEKKLFSKLEREYQDVVWVNISIDVNLKHWKEFTIKNQLPGIHLIALNGGIYGKNPLVNKLMKVSSYPSYILIDKEGRILGHELSNPSEVNILEYMIYRGLEGVKSGDAFKEMMTAAEPSLPFLMQKAKKD